jgi:hypothetical protein
MRVVKLRRWIRRFRSWRTEHWIALASAMVSACSAFIAMCALTLSISEARAARRHDRLSVKPRYVFSFYYDDTGVGWRDVNIGLGPARVRGFRVLVDGVAQKPVPVFAQILKTAFNIPPNSNVKFLNPRAGAIIKPDESDIVFWVPSGPDAQKVMAGYNRVSFEACYCSIYDECWLFSSSSGRLEGTRDDSCSTFSKEPPSEWWEP